MHQQYTRQSGCNITQHARMLLLSTSLLASLIFAGFLTLTLSPTASADELKRLTAEEIRLLLAGNTAVGAWNGNNYRQFFAEDGITIYEQEGSPSSKGEWRVREKDNTYQSWWPRSDWSSYPIASDGTTHFWISHSLPPQPFEMLPGRKLKP